MTSTLQAFLIFKTSLSLTSLPPKKSRRQLDLSSHRRHHYHSACSLSFDNSSLFTHLNSLLCPRHNSILCALPPDNNASLSPELNDSSVENANSIFSESKSDEVDVDSGDSLGFDEAVESDKSVVGEVNGENVAEGAGREGNLVEKEGVNGKLRVVVFLMGLWAMARRGVEKALAWDWLSWFPFWHHEKRLERLIAEADASPKDPAKQGALLAELNKHRLAGAVFSFLVKNV